MMSSEIIILFDLPSFIADTSVIGDAKPGPGYHQYRDSTQTVIFDVTNFNGELKLQGTLEVFPSESDWVDLKISNLNSSVSILGDQSGTTPITFVGNFVWVRVVGSVIASDNIQVRYLF